MPQGGQRTPRPTGQRGVEAVVAGVGSRAPRHSWGWGTAGRGAELAGEVSSMSGSAQREPLGLGPGELWEQVNICLREQP